MRGKRFSRFRKTSRHGITPADAGKTPYITYEVATDRDHPRGCGENQRYNPCIPVARGSPPRMRGKPISGLTGVTANRITPADAGKTKATLNERFVNQDHPRGCGENYERGNYAASGMGSPPRMRGKLYCWHKPSLNLGITPADAGKTSDTVACGCDRHGSPPRMRGKHDVSIAHRKLAGITPADAGKTSLHRPPSFCARDHPRGCGENLHFLLGAAVAQGSPPRMRGKHPAVGGCRYAAGITPADAGKTRLQRRINMQNEDHPRGCGENMKEVPCVCVDDGSPPRMRGKPGDRCVHQYRRGITPADAGKT